MVKYSLVTKNMITDKIEVLIEKKPLIEIDKFIYEQFSSLDEIKKYFKVSSDSELKIKYIYQSGPKYLDLILKNNLNYSFLSILENTSGAYIDDRVDAFNIMINNFINSVTVDEIKFLRNQGYINKKTFFDLLDYKKGLNEDKKEIYYDIKRDLKRYLEFRKLYIGIQKYRNKSKVKEDEMKNIISTGDEYLNDLYNKGDLDEVYGSYDIDDLRNIEGIEQLNIDGLGKKR